MPLSQWTDWNDEYDPHASDRESIVTADLDGDYLVAIVTDKAIGLKADHGDPVDYWFPISQIHGDIPRRNTWIDSIQIPRWLAEEKDLEYR
jgi:hypothetical protein